LEGVAAMEEAGGMEGAEGQGTARVVVLRRTGLLRAVEVERTQEVATHLVETVVQEVVPSAGPSTIRRPELSM
jgi:hypothetical protein